MSAKANSSVHRAGPFEIQKIYERHARILSSRHPKFRRIILAVGPLRYKIPVWKSVNRAVLYAVIGQMLSVKAASSIINRLLRHYGSPDKILSWAHKTRHIAKPLHGVSIRKRRALSEWHRFYSKRGEVCKSWSRCEAGSFRNQVTSIWGFGNWAADMIGIFHLGRLDIWPASDTGLKRACTEVFGTTDSGRVKKYIGQCETVAALYLWQYLDFKNKNFC